MIASGAVASGCDRGRREPAPAPPKAPPVRPAALVAELVVPNPGETWRALRPMLGAPAALLPVGPELALGAALELGPLAASSFELSRPLLGGWVAPGAGLPDFATAIALSNGNELVAALTTGSSASHRVEKKGELAFLLPNAAPKPGRPGPVAVAVVGDRLLVGKREALEVAGEYLGRPFSVKPGGGVGAARLDAEPRALAELGRAAWAEQRQRLAGLAQRAQARHGRPADFAEPAAVLSALGGTVDGALTALEGAKSVVVELDVEAQRVELEARLASSSPAPHRSPPAPLPHPLGELPNTVLAAYWTQRDAGASGELGFAHLLRALFGERLGERRAAELERIERALDAARGDHHTLAITHDFTLLWTGPVRDAAALRRAFSDAVGSLDDPPFREPLTAFVGAPRIARSSVNLPGRGAAERFRFHFARVPGRPPSKPPPTIEAWVLVETERFTFALGQSAEAALSAVLSASAPEQRLRGRPGVQAALERLGPEASFAVFADLGQSGGKGAPLLAFGFARELERVLRVELGDATLETLIRWGIAP